MVTENPTYVLTEDTGAITQQVFGRTYPGLNRGYYEVIQGEVWRAINGIDPGIEMLVFFEESMGAELEAAVAAELDDDPNAVCICLDRFLLSGLEEDKEYGQRLARFSITRQLDGAKVPRQGEAKFEEQMQNLWTKFPDIQERQIIIADDGLFTGGTVNNFIELLDKQGLRGNVAKVIGIIGNEGIEKLGEVPVEILESVGNLYEWIDIRDFSVFGGKKLNSGRRNRASSAVPYIAPWSDGKAASLDKSPYFFDVSISMLEGMKEMIESYQEKSGQLRFRDLINAGFAFPTNPDKTIPVSRDMPVTDYLNQCVELIKREREREVFVFDMDGTLYELEGRAFTNSSLERQVISNAVQFVMDREGCGLEEAQSIVDQAGQNPLGISQGLVERYGITRNDYFDTVWNIDPSDILVNYEDAVRTIQQLAEQGGNPKLVLLTAAPRVWAKQVLKFLGLDEVFEQVYTGDTFKTKEEIFRMLSGRYRRENVWSIGDQLETDIEPAQRYEFNTLLVSKPSDITLIVNKK